MPRARLGTISLEPIATLQHVRVSEKSGKAGLCAGFNAYNIDVTSEKMDGQAKLTRHVPLVMLTQAPTSHFARHQLFHQ
jgi:hypothetical protein